MKRFLLCSAMVILCFTALSQTASDTNDTLYQGFLSPPDAAKPRVWWHWMNGNITKDGIRKDLEWMKRSGIGGFQNFDAALSTPQIVKQRLTYMTPEWKDAFRFTTRLADSLHLEMAIAASPGWSESGGPWVKAQDGMKKIVWTETFAKSGASDLTIAEPAHTTGPFQNIPLSGTFDGDNPIDTSTDFYRDVAVIAYKLPPNDIPINELKPEVTSSGGNFSLTQLTDGDVAKTNLLPRDTVTGSAWIQFAFVKPQTIKAVTIVGGGDKGPFGLYGELKDTRSVEASDDGVDFKWICYIPAGEVLEQTIDIPPTTARYFRVTFKNPPPLPNLAEMFGTGGESPKPPPGTPIAELVLHTVSRVNMFEEKDAFAPASDLFEKTTPSTPDAIALTDVVDISGKLKPGGKLDWQVPNGDWIIIRFGYSLLGITNHPASPEATGPEVDKLDSIAVRNYFTNYLEQYKSATEGLMGDKGGLQYMVTDSWEAGAQNWTANFLQEFQKRHGYSMLPWMPVLTGHIVKSAEASEQFLFDYRKTLSDLITEYHYDALTDILREYGMKRYSESHESGRALIADGMEIKRNAAIPMSAMWTPNLLVNGNDQTNYEADIRESASVAHIYGQNLVAAESFTALGIGGTAWSYSPENLKPTADLELASGLNRFIIHTSVHQPSDDKIPGLGLGPFGQWFTRHETWAEEAKAWTDYLARSCYMLQQGKFVADILYYYGEDNNITSLFRKKLPFIPEGYNYDFVNADALIKLLSVKDGILVTPSGMRYRLLVLDSNAQEMSLPVLRKLYALVNAGAVITGIKPKGTPSLEDDSREFSRIVNEIWSGRYPNVHINQTLPEVLRQLNVPADFSFSSQQTDSKLMYVHRRLVDGDIYWINNRNNRDEILNARFRVEGKEPKLWHAETGKSEPVSFSMRNGFTEVALHLQPFDAVFIVFKTDAVKRSATVPTFTEKSLVRLDGSWKINFQKGRGAPDSITLNSLGSYTEQEDTGIKYFSGTASYTKIIIADRNWFRNKSQLWLDLGEVKNLAEVIVNGQSVGILWKKPFRAEVTKVLKPGVNNIEVRVTNLWVNRLIGDVQPGVKKRITFTTMPFYRPDSPLLPAGLLGPVQLVSLNSE